MRPSRTLAAVSALVLAAFAGFLALESGDEDTGTRDPEPVVSDAPEAPAGAPNLLVAMVDDQAVSTYDRKAMPRIHRFFARGGTTFDQAIAAPPLCCPSRAGFLTGLYPRHHGVVENDQGYRTMKGKESTFPVALQAAGYRTAMIGKFMNGYEPFADAEPAPGFDRWYAIHGYADYFDPEISDDGKIATAPGYTTTTLTSKAIEFTDQVWEEEAPFFLWLSYQAPHTVLPDYPKPCNGESAQPETAADFVRFADEELPRPPSFGNAEVSGRPSLAGTEPLGPMKLASTTRAWRCARASLVSVDRQFDRLVEHLEAIGQLADTVVVYVSDNGYFYGEHRLADDKRLPLEPALRIPMAIRPGNTIDPAPPASSDALVSQVDIGPTLLDLAGVEPCPQDGCRPFDGRSLRPVLEGSRDWPVNRAIPLVLDDGWTYEALRTPGHLYMEVSSSRQHDYGEPRPELYDLRRDPDELINVAGDPRYGTVERRLEARLSARRSR